jgi:hypothetical protein
MMTGVAVSAADDSALTLVCTARFQARKDVSRRRFDHYISGLADSE